MGDNIIDSQIFYEKLKIITMGYLVRGYEMYFNFIYFGAH